MPNDDHLNRRRFLEAVGAGALLGAAGLTRNRALAASNTTSWTPPPVLKNPNILVIMVDQLRPPMWLSASQSASLTQILPNIMGRIVNTSYNFNQFFVAATMCTPSRAALLTGLYAPQTALYLTLDASTTGAPSLNPAFPTWGEALTTLNSAYQGNVWWFGKWHLSQELIANPLQQYGFNTRTYPGGPAPPYNPSPDGAANEGADGGLFGNNVWASDAMIANDFIGWLQGQAPTTGQPNTPWCATVSFINPHDITVAPAWLQSNPFPPTNVPTQPVYFPPASGVGSPPSFYTANPSPWNYENLAQVPNKPTVQVDYLNYLSKEVGAVSSWVLLLNQYFFLQNLVDQQIGLVLNALSSSAFANNTVVIFLSDHGEYGGSHGLHTKGFAVYDEGISVPFCIQFPGQTAPVAMNQMCSAVDFFGLICDLVTGGSGQWMLAYPDLAIRQSIWSFLYNNCSETRVAPAPVDIPYILHTFDGGGNSFPYAHITCLRTKQDLSAGCVGGKLAFYANWNSCATYPNSSTPQPEFYDYNPQTTNNTAETGNDYYSNNATTQSTIANYVQVLGSWGPPGTGMIGNELNAPLIGTGTNGQPLSQALASAQQVYFNYLNGSGTCTG
jgi:arylsulfatase A-like enzyme